MRVARGLGFVVGWTAVGLSATGSGCGEVKPSVADPPPTDAPPLDGPSPTKTAISLDSIDPFAAPSLVYTKVPFTTEARDDLDEFDLTQSRFTASHPGDYQVCAAVLASGNPALTLELDLYRNGGRERAFAYGIGVAEGCGGLHLGAGDTLEVRLSHNANSTQMFTVAPEWNWMTIDELPMLVSIDLAPSFQVTPGGFIQVPYTTELKDTRNEFDPDSHRFTASQAGDYQVCASLFVGTPVAFELDIYVNGGRERGIAANNGAVTGCRSVRLAAGDQIEIWMEQNTSAAVPISLDPAWDWLTIQQLPTSVSIGNTMTFAVLNQTLTRVPYATKLFDDHGELDPAASRFQPSSAGDYLICASLYSGATIAIATELDVFKSGEREKGFAFGTNPAIGGCRVLRLGAADTVEFDYSQSSGVTATIAPNPFWNWLTVSRLDR
jgi:hypothetical protein